MEHSFVSNSLDSRRYAQIPRILSQVLNVDSTLILQQYASASVSADEVHDFLPNISLPPDLWLQQDLVVKDVKVKIPLLKEINLMLAGDVARLASPDPFYVDEAALLYYERLISAYDLLSFERNPPDFEPLREDDEYLEEYDNMSTLGKTLSFPETRQPRPVSSSSHKLRMSNLSRDFRKLSFLGLHAHHDDDETLKTASSPVATSTPQSSQNTSPASPHLPNKQMAGLLSKSKARFYTKLKRRDSLSSVISTPTTVSSTNSNASFRRKSNMSDDRSTRRSLTLSGIQRQDNQRDKHEYYTQVQSFVENITAVLPYLGKPGSRASLARLMDFLKTNVFKFIMIDVAMMLIDYAHLKASI